MPKPDRRVQRTRKELHRALIELVLARGWEATSVQDVCEHANVGRSTFYAHFADKEELLISGFDELREMLRKSHGAGGGRPFGFARDLMVHAREYQPLVRAMVGNHAGQAAKERLRQLILELAREDLAARSELSEPWLEGTARYVTGAYLEVLAWWLEMHKPVDVANVDEIFHRLTAQVLEHSRR